MAVIHRRVGRRVAALEETASTFIVRTSNRLVVLVYFDNEPRRRSLNLTKDEATRRGRQHRQAAGSAQSERRELTPPEAGGSDGITIAPALDTAAAVIIPLPLPCESLPGPKSLKRIAAVPTTATIAATITGIKPRRSFL